MQNNWPPINSAIPLTPGALIANRYRLQKPLGTGGYGQVFLADDSKFKMPRQVAIKFLHPEFLVEPEVRDDLEQEASILAQLNHPNILRVIDFEINDRMAYVITDYAAGGSLDELLRPGTGKKLIQLPLEKVAFYLEHLADALDYAHSKGLIHRDIKPLNVLLDSRGQPLLADFGMATPLSNSKSSLLMNVDTSGTPFYMAPEQWQGMAGKASDIYSLAIMTFEMIAGKPPFQGTQLEVMGQHITMPVPKLRDKAVDLSYPASMDTVLAEALAKDPHKRTHPAMEFYRQFQTALNLTVQPSTAQPIAVPTPKVSTSKQVQVANYQPPIVPTPINQPSNRVNNQIIKQNRLKKRILTQVIGYGIGILILFIIGVFATIRDSNSNSQAVIIPTQTIAPVATRLSTATPTIRIVTTNAPTRSGISTPINTLDGVPIYLGATSITVPDTIKSRYSSSASKDKNFLLEAYKTMDDMPKIKSGFISNFDNAGWKDTLAGYPTSTPSSSLNSYDGFILTYEKGNKLAIVFGIPNSFVSQEGFTEINHGENVIEAISWNM